MSVSTRTEQLDDLYTTTWNNRAKQLTDQIFDNSSAYAAIKKAGGIQLNGTGGRYLEIPLSYAKNETVTSIGKGDTVSLSDTTFMTVAQFEWKYAAGTIMRYFVDDSKNKSVSRHIDWANAKLNNLRDSMTDYFEQKLFGDGTGNGSKDIDGLGNIVAATPTSGTVGNINRATYSWWQNRTKTATGAASVYLLSDMRNLANTCSEGKVRSFPNLIITTQAVAELFDDEVLEQRQIVNQSTGDPEFMKTQWKGIPLVWSGNCSSGYMYMINTANVGLNVDPDINFTMTSWKSIPNQVEDRVAQIVWKGNFISNRCKSLGIMISIA